MTEKERSAFIENKILEAKEKEEEKKAIQQAKKEKALANASMQASNGATWIFDNPSLLASGQIDFIGTWGDRPLEDNWRRLDKSSVSFDVISQDNDNSEEVGEDLPEDQTANFYLKGLPLRIDQQEVVHQKIMNSYYQIYQH